MSKILGPAAALLALFTLTVYGCLFLGGGPSSASSLVSTALGAGPLQEREAATVELGRIGPDAIPALRQVLAESETPSVQAAAIDGLVYLKDWEGMPQFFDLLENSDSQLVRNRAAGAITRLIGADYKYQSASSPEQRQRAAQFMRREYEAMKKNPPPEYQTASTP